MVPTAGVQTQSRIARAPLARGFPWLSVILLTLTHLSLAWSLDVAKWAEGLHVVVYAVLAGVVVGSLLAMTPWPRGFVRLYTLVTGLAFTLYLGATLLPPTAQNQERAIYVLQRVAQWVIAALTGEPTGDNLVFVVDVTFLMWWLSVATTVGLVRERKVWAAVVPTGIALSINAYYAVQDLTGFVLLYLGATLLLLVSSHLDEQVTIWEMNHIRYPLDVVFIFLRNGLVFSLVILVLAWYAPKVTGRHHIERWLEPVKGSWHRVQEEWARVFSTLNYTSSGVIPSFGSTMSFRGAPNLTDVPYFTVRAAKGRYWRAAVYDAYRGTGWQDTVSQTRALDANESVRLPLVQTGEILTQTVTVQLPGAINLIAAPMPFSFNIPVEAQVLSYKGQLGGGEEILFVYATRVLEVGEQYTVVSYVVDPDATSLRNAPTTYPDWIRERYLSLPVEVPDRVRNLARDLTVAYDNPYDKAKAIERYLRSIEYSEDIPAPPRDRDAVDWFLFELQKGYCDYYASAMAVMLRAVGVPTRIASGYARGEYDEETSTWTVRESDAHTWPEVYFPGYGWIPFEPTPSEPPLERRESPPTTAGDEEDLLREEEIPDRERNIPEDEENIAPEGTGFPLMPISLPLFPSLNRFVRFVPWRPLIGLLGLVILGFGARLITRRRLLSHPDLPATLYGRLIRWGHRLGLRLSPALTPWEYRQALVRALPREAEAITEIVQTYQVSVYAPAPHRDRAMQRSARLIALWEHLWPRLWWAWMRRHVTRLAHSVVRAVK